jgi:hypothetical protein
VNFSKKLFSTETGDSVIASLKEKGFQNRTSKVSARNGNPNSAYNQIFNSDGLLQVGNILLKISIDDQFIYSLKQEFSTPEAFNNLLSEVYDAARMNKIVVDRNIYDNFNFDAFSQQNPHGIQESLVGGSVEKRPMFGTTHTTGTEAPYGTPLINHLYGGCHQMMCTPVHHTQYVFWIGVDHWTTYTNCHWVSVSGGC